MNHFKDKHLVLPCFCTNLFWFMFHCFSSSFRFCLNFKSISPVWLKNLQIDHTQYFDMHTVHNMYHLFREVGFKTSTSLFTHISGSLNIRDGVKQYVQTPGKYSCVIWFSCHGIRFTRICDTICKQQSILSLH